MNYKDTATIVGLVVLNLAAVWVLVLRGGAWFEGTGLFSWQVRRQFRADAPMMSEGIFKLIAGAFVLIELVVAVAWLFSR